MAKITFRTLGPNPLPDLVVEDEMFQLQIPQADFIEREVELKTGVERVVIAIEWLPIKVWGVSETTIEAFRERGGSDVFVSTNNNNNFHFKECYISPEQNGERQLHFAQSVLVDQDDL